MWVDDARASRARRARAARARALLRYDFLDDLSEGATLPYYTLELEDKKKKVPGLLALVFIDETANTAGGVVFNTRLRQLVEVPLEKLPRGKPTLDKEGLRAADEALQVRVYGARGREGPGCGWVRPRGGG